MFRIEIVTSVRFRVHILNLGCNKLQAQGQVTEVVANVFFTTPLIFTMLSATTPITTALQIYIEVFLSVLVVFDNVE